MQRVRVRNGGGVVRLHPDAIETAILVGYAHLWYHVTRPHLYIPSRRRGKGCFFCLDAIGAEAPRSAPTSREIVEQWCLGLGEYAGAMLRAIVDAYPRGLTREQISERSGRSQTSSMFLPALRELKKNNLIRESDGEYVANPDELLL